MNTPAPPLSVADNRPRGIRNNNPGNIEDGPIRWRGRVGNDGRYAIFDTPVNGIRAMALEIWDSIERDGDNTVRRLVMQWAPPTENLTGAYVASVAKQTGLQPDEILVYSRDVKGLIKAIVQHENGIMPYDEATIDGAIRAAGK